MKTAEEIFKKNLEYFYKKREDYKNTYSIRDDEGNILEEAIMPHGGYNFSLPYDALYSAMKEYAKEACMEALKNASENAVMVNRFGNDIGSFAFDENSNKIWINKQSILNESNIPSL